MRRPESCSHCGGKDITTGTLKVGSGDAQIVIAGKPDGFLGVIPYTTSPVRANVCRSCGHIALFATQMTDLLAIEPDTNDTSI